MFTESTQCMRYSNVKSLRNIVQWMAVMKWPVLNATGQQQCTKIQHPRRVKWITETSCCTPHISDDDDNSNDAFSQSTSSVKDPPPPTHTHTHTQNTDMKCEGKIRRYFPPYKGPVYAYSLRRCYAEVIQLASKTQHKWLKPQKRKRVTRIVSLHLLHFSATTHMI